MSTNQHNAIRYGDEYQCAKCGKSWDVDDDVPPCLTSAEIAQLNIKQLRGIIRNND